MHLYVRQRADKINAITRMTSGRIACFDRHDLGTSERLVCVCVCSLR